MTGTNIIAAPGYPIPIQAGSVSVQNGALLTHPYTTPNQEYSLVMTVSNGLVVDPLSRIDVSGRGYPVNYTLGDYMLASNMMYNGGSYGGAGSFAGGGVTAIPTYGDPHNPDNLGTGSGPFVNGGAGGGLVRITAGSAEIDGAIFANGQAGIDSGSGGGILLNAGTVSGKGYITANGGPATGNGNNGIGANGGGGGRIAIYTWQAMSLPATNVSASGGTGTNSGQAGTVVTSSTPWPSFIGLSSSWHGNFPFSWVSLGIGPNSTVQGEITISGSAGVVFDQEVPTTGSLSWDSTSVGNGNYAVTLTLFNGTVAVGQASQSGFVNNSVSWHEGTVTTNQTWSSNTVNVVDQTIVIPSGVTVTIAPGAIVKFAPGTQIIVQPGGTLNALDTSVAPIIFTSLYDDSAGGDSDLDGGVNTPHPGDWAGIAVVGGQFVENSFVSILYTEQVVGGTLSTSETLLGNAVYIVSTPMTVPAGLTLTINPGAVLKFDRGSGITVNQGGTLSAFGTSTQPIIFTSAKDDTVGGNTGGAGSASTPQPGDWVGINIKGKATFVHSDIRYGGATGSGAGASGVLIVLAGQLMFSNSVVEYTLYDGISVDQGGVGTIVNSVLRNTDRAIWDHGTGTFVQVINCTLDQNLVGVDQHDNGATLTVQNSIIANSIQGSSLDFSVNFSNCDLWSSYGASANPSGVIGSNGNVSADPKFVNEAQQDYRLNYGSPCIDAASGALAPPSDFAGDPRYNDPRTSPKTGLPDALGNYPDMGAFEFVETAPSDVDLVVSSVSSPTIVQANSSVTLQWTDENVGSGSAIGPWHDSVSLVSQSDTNTVLAVGEVLVGQGVNLGPGQSYSPTATFRVPGGVEGNYLLQIHVNNRGDTFEAAQWTNNTTLSTTPTSLIVPTLPVGGSVSGQLTVSGQADVYKVVPAAGQDVQLTFQTTSGSNYLQLFVAQGYAPGPPAFALKSGQFNSPVATLNIAAPNGGVYYVAAYPEVLVSFPAAYTLAAVAPTAVSLSGATPHQLAANGQTTLDITGSLLSASDTYELVGAGGTFTASSVNVPDPTTAYATFSLNGAPAGSYNLEVLVPGAPPAVLSNATSVVTGPALPAFWAQLQLPSVYRQGRPFSGAILYGNNGNADMPAPILILSSGGVAGLQLFPTNAFSTNDVFLIGASLSGPAGVLRPNQSWTIPFTALSTVSETIPFRLAYETADATDRVDYAALAVTARPPGYSDAAWNTVWNAFQSEAGPTWDELINLLDHYATVMAEAANQGQSVGTFFLESDVIAYAVADIAAQTQTSVAGTLYLSDTNHSLAFTDLYLTGSDTNQFGIATSGEDGAFRFLNLTGGVYSVSVPGFWLPAPVQVTVPVSGSVTGLTFIVQQGGTIAGTIRNQSGTLVLPNVSVTAVSTGSNGVLSVSSASDGSFVLSWFATGHLRSDGRWRPVRDSNDRGTLRGQ